jgi:tetratricopeptide (TPR) repeat protein
LCAQGDGLAAQKEFKQAFECYRDALNLVPEPVEDWEATTWILAAIGDLYFLMGNYEKAVRAFEDAVRCPGGLGNPFIHLRLGECHLELGHPERALDELLRAYMGGGRDVFQTEEPKYFEFLQSRVKLSRDS